MHKMTPYAEVLTTGVLIVLLIAFLNPTGLLMPQSTEMMLLVLFTVAFVAFLGFFWKEQAADEREHAHQLAAGRISFFVGSTVLTLGIIAQALRHDIDPWLVGALILMILTKLIVRIYARFTH